MSQGSTLVLEVAYADSEPEGDRTAFNRRPPT